MDNNSAQSNNSQSQGSYLSISSDDEKQLYLIQQETVFMKKKQFEKWNKHYSSIAEYEKEQEQERNAKSHSNLRCRRKYTKEQKIFKNIKAVVIEVQKRIKAEK